MKLYLEDFEAGIQSALLKMAQDVFDLGGSAIFPRIDTQAKWRFARGKNHLRLTDGTHVYSFHLPYGESHDADFPAERTEDIPYTSFHQDAESHGTAQIHKADPGSIYFTLQDGRSNPTYTLRHQGGKTWKAIPKKRTQKVAYINKEEFLKGATDMVKKANPFYELGDTAIRGLTDGANSAMNAGMSISKIPEVRSPDWLHQLTGSSHIPSPLVAAGVGAGIGGAYDQIKRRLYNSDEENEEEGGLRRLITRYALPAAGMAGAHSLQKSLWPNYSDLAPVFDR